jgi:hypothetical protein
LLFKNRRRVASTAVFCVVSGAAALLAYALSLRYQSPAAKPPAYTDGALLIHRSWDYIRANLAINLFSLVALPTTATLALAPFVPRLRLLAAYGLLASGGFAALSFLGMMPWQIDTRWGLSLQSLSALSLALLLALALDAFKRHRAITAIIAVCVIASVRVNFKETREYQRPQNDSLYDLLPKVDFSSLVGRKVFVGQDASATLRYLYEYGPFRGRPEYPSQFLFENTLVPLPPEELLRQSGYLLLSRMDQPAILAYQNRFAQKLKEVPGLHPSHLYEVIKY